MTLKVPLTGTNVTPEGEGPAANGGGEIPGQIQPPAAPQPKPQRASLHQLRMNAPQSQVEVRGEFDDKGRVKWVPVEQAQEPTQVADVEDSGSSTADALGEAHGFDVPPLPDSPSNEVGALQRQIEDLTQTVQLLARTQLQGAQPPQQKPTAPAPPDPTQFDFYDPAQTAEFHRLNNAYTQAIVRHEVNAALEPHGGALQDARLNAEYNRVLAQHGAEPNFKATMDAALRLVAGFPNISIPDAYNHMASQSITSPRQSAAPAQPTAKPANRTITAQEAAQKAEQAKKLPASNGVSGTAEPALPANLRSVNALGRIMLHNQQSGRARPIGN